VICSACGFDNPGAMRFCGMCGVPLPQRPITTPGAQSTLRFTRIPVDARSPLSERNANPVSSNPSSVSNTAASGVLENPPFSPPGPIRAADQAVPASVQRDVAVPAEPPPKELVPDVPLDEYVQKFHYEPPNDPAEVTMRGEAHAAAPDHSTGPTITNEPVVEATSGSSIVSGTSTDVKPAAAAADQDSRLGLEPEAAAETHIPRPRFLDINEPPKETAKESSGTPTIAGPSFLGLNETPQNWAEAVGVEPGDYAPRSSHRRAWIAAVAVLVIAVLALLEWRAQRSETNDGPVEIIRTQIRNLRHGASQQGGSENSASATAPAGTDSNAKPEMQVQQQPKPQAQPKDTSPGSDDRSNAGVGATAQPSATNSAGSAENQTPGDQSGAASMPATPQAAQTEQAGAAPATATPRQKPTSSTADNSQSSSTQQTQPALKTKRQQVDKSDDSDAAGKQAIPGADEMSKAKNASDSAAAAAWLWKATAKGNPDAPVQLADMYINGDGVPRSCEQALVLLKTAAEKENARARNRLAAMYSTGICVQRNRVEAYRWLSSALAANPNSQWAQQNRDLLWQQMNPEERAAAEKYR
jgi:hypothetical protein